MKLGQVTIVIEPEADFAQEEPHLYIRLYHGKTVDGVFHRMYFSEVRKTGQQFLQWIAAFQDLDGRFFQQLIDDGDLRGMVK